MIANSVLDQLIADARILILRIEENINERSMQIVKIDKYVEASTMKVEMMKGNTTEIKLLEEEMNVIYNMLKNYNIIRITI